MPSAIEPNEDVQLRIAELLEQITICVGPLQTQDPQQRQRITLDAISAGLTIAAITTVNAVGSVTNIAAIAGEGVRQFEIPASNNFANAILSNLNFG